MCLLHGGTKKRATKTSLWFSVSFSKGPPLLWNSPPHPWDPSVLSLHLSFAVDFSLGQGRSPSFTGIPDMAFFQPLAVIKMEHSIFLVNGKLKLILKTNFCVSLCCFWGSIMVWESLWPLNASSTSSRDFLCCWASHCG